jgi:hypothetical protein
MIGSQLDTFARQLARSMRRRPAIGVLAGPLSFGLARPQPALACKKVGKKCDKTKDCCDGARCGGKKCKCKNGFSKCNKRCYDLDQDANHCGACNNACAAGETCCDGQCVDLQTDVTNCGSCGRACDENMECVVGVCRFPPGTCLHGLAACVTAGTLTCGESFDCRCYQSTEGEIICGDVADVHRPCGECASSADCASYGPGAFCIETGTHFCGCGTSTQNYCGLPCDA